MEITGNIWHIQRYNVHDGKGIRTIVFFKGCPLHCLWCANPEGISSRQEIKFNAEKCIGCRGCVQLCPNGANILSEQGVSLDWNKCKACRTCISACTVGARECLGQKVTVHEVMEELRKDFVFFRNSGGGLTLSGGEALLQAEFAQELLKEAKKEHFDTAVETCGNVPWASFESVMPYTDMFMVDIKHMDPVKHRELTGCDNALILKNARMLLKKGAPVVFRVPVIPGLNDSEDNIKALAGFASETQPLQVELLPYHQLGVSKYEMMGKQYMLPDIVPPDSRRMEEIGRLMEPIFSRLLINR
ncbi:MAG: glycyl-radical enzyme activating protein [Christensenellales bacterium]